MTPTPEEEIDERESEAVGQWLKRTLSQGDQTRSPNLLPGIQRRIRLRSKGKFFRDGWSTMQGPAGHLLIAITTLLMVALAYFALAPWGFR